MLLLYILFYFPPPIIFPSVHITHLPLSAASISLSEKLCSLWTRYRSHFLIECAGEQSCLATLSSNPCAESWSNFLQPLESGLTRKSDVVKHASVLLCVICCSNSWFLYTPGKGLGGGVLASDVLSVFQWKVYSWHFFLPAHVYPSQSWLDLSDVSHYSSVRF